MQNVTSNGYPGYHAEFHALNEALLARGPGGSISMSKLGIYVIRTATDLSVSGENKSPNSRSLFALSGVRQTVEGQGDQFQRGFVAGLEGAWFVWYKRKP
jgi:hypothetical protein